MQLELLCRVVPQQGFGKVPIFLARQFNLKPPQQSIMTCSKMYGILREVGVSVSLEQVTYTRNFLMIISCWFGKRRRQHHISITMIAIDITIIPSVTWRKATWMTWRQNRVQEAFWIILARMRRTLNPSTARGHDPHIYGNRSLGGLVVVVLVGVSNANCKG